MNCDQLEEILNRGEDSNHQFKANFKSIDQLAVEISALANSDGGMIIIGVSDECDLIGISKKDVSRLNQWISNATSNKIDKQIFVKTEINICDKKRILIIQVPRGINKPYAVNRVDVWVKSGADKRRAPVEEILRLAQTSGFLYADESETETTVDDIDLDFFKDRSHTFYQEKIERLEIPIKTLLVNIKLMQNDKLTLAGLLLFGKNPEFVKPQFGIKATYFEGCEISGQKYKDSEIIRGKLINQYLDGIYFIKRNLRRIQGNQNFNAPGILEIPEETFSETIANAIAHRNYYIDSSIQINLFDDRLEVNSPGNLPNTINEENIKFGVHIERNPIMLYFLEKDPKFRYSGKGTGIPRVIKLCEEADLKVKFINDKQKQQFSVIFYRKSENC